MEYLIQFIYGFCATLPFGIILQAPRKASLFSGIVGGIGWTVYKYLLDTFQETVLIAMLSSIIIGTLSAIIAIIMKVPMITLYLPSLIPLVPGGGMYYTMYYLIIEEMDLFTSKAIETTLVAISLATGIFVSTTVVNIVNRTFIQKIIKH